MIDIKEDKSIVVAKQVLENNEIGERLTDLSDDLLVSHLPVYVFSKLIYELQKAATKEILDERFRIRNPFGPGGE